MTCFSLILSDDHVVHLPIVRGFLAGPVDIPVNIMLLTGSTVNFSSRNQDGRIATNFNVDESSLFTEVADNVLITLNRLNLDLHLLKFRLTKPANNWVEVLEGIHPFPRLELDERIVRSYKMNGPLPRPEGGVDILLGIADLLKLLRKKHVFLKNSFSLLPIVYGYVPCGSQPVKTLTDPRNMATRPSSSYLRSMKALTKAMEKM